MREKRDRWKFHKWRCPLRFALYSHGTRARRTHKDPHARPQTFKGASAPPPPPMKAPIYWCCVKLFKCCWGDLYPIRCVAERLGCFCATDGAFSSPTRLTLPLYSFNNLQMSVMRIKVHNWLVSIDYKMFGLWKSKKGICSSLKKKISHRGSLVLQITFAQWFCAKIFFHRLRN